MGLFSFLTDLFSYDPADFGHSSESMDTGNSIRDDPSNISQMVINPTTGLPMVSDCPAGIDVGGHNYGETPDHSSNLGCHDSWSLDSGSSFDCGSSFESGSCFDSGSSFDLGSSFDSGMGDW